MKRVSPAKKPKNLPLPIKIQQAGLSWSKNQFMMISGGLGLAERQTGGGRPLF